MRFSTIEQKLLYYQKDKKEVELFPYLKQLFLINYDNVEITHGNSEFGKDLVFSQYDENLQEIKWFAVVVKNKKGTQSDFESGGEIQRQIDTAFKHPYTGSKGVKVYMNTVIVIVNGAVTGQAKSILSHCLEAYQLNNVYIWNYQRLSTEFEKIKDIFLSSNEGELEIILDKYKRNQITFLSNISNSKEILHGLDISDINDIYVNIKTTYSRYSKNKKAYLDYSSGNSSPSPHEELDESMAIIKSKSNFIIKGIAASGKSLLLKRIGINSLNKLQACACFYFELRKFNKITINFNIDDIIQKQYNELTQGETFDSNKFIKIILLFDGLDELKDEEDKISILKTIDAYNKKLSFSTNFRTKLIDLNVPAYLIEDLNILEGLDFKDEAELETKLNSIIGIGTTKQFLSQIIQASHVNSDPDKTKYQIILSTRTNEIIEDHLLFTDFENIDLLPFDVGQALSLVKKVIPDNKEKANNFINAIKSNQLANSLTRTPMALTLTAILYRDDEIDLKELPANITELYNKFSDHFLNRWDTSRGISLQYKYEEAKRILSFVAKHLHENGEQEISKRDLKNYLEELSKFYPYEDLTDINSFILKLKDRVGLITLSKDEELFRFSHLSFQEYFASLHFDDSNEHELIENYLNEWWENIIIFYCGKNPNREVFLKKVTAKLVPINIEQGYNFLSLMSKCLQAAHLISKPAQEKFLINMIAKFDQFYRMVLKINKENESGISYLISTLDFIIKFRELFTELFSTKKIYIDNLETISLDILTDSSNEYTDVTKYSLAYFLSNKTRNQLYIEAFAKLPDLDIIWSRILFTDINLFNFRRKIDENLYKRIKKKQLKRKFQIINQFNKPGINLIVES